MNCFYSGCVLMVLCFYTCVLAGSEICYDCSGIECNDPFNVTNADVMNCSAPSIYRAVKTNIDLQPEEKLFPSIFGYRATSTEYACVKFVYEIDSVHHNSTVRRCVEKTIACETIKNNVGAVIGKVHSCSTCDSDLCNSGVTLMQSFVLSLSLVCFLKILE